MKKIMTIFTTMLLFISCTNSSFKNQKEVYFYGKELKVGDILLKQRRANISSIFGHVGIITSENTVGDIPKLGKKYYEVDLETWLQEERKVIVLRYRKKTLEFEKELLKTLSKYKNISYGISLDKMETQKMYCSQFIWRLYYETSKNLNFFLDIDGNGGNIVFPYDFLESKELEQVLFNILN